MLKKALNRLVGRMQFKGNKQVLQKSKKVLIITDFGEHHHSGEFQTPDSGLKWENLQRFSPLCKLLCK